MSELEQSLSVLAAELDWPATPDLSIPAGSAPARRPRLLLAVAVAAIAAIAVAMAVPGARSAILRALHLGGVTIERVDLLPRAEERPLASSLGPAVSAAAAAQALGRPVALPRVSGRPQLYLSSGVVSVLLAAPDPMLLSQFATGDEPAILQKLVSGSTGVAPVSVDRAPGYWISGEVHLYMAPGAPPRLAGNALLWQRNGITYRLEGRSLSEAQALRLARQIDGT